MGVYRNFKEYSDYVEQKYKEWTEKYNIPEHMEFELKTMFELEEQFKNQPPENVKTKRDILDMITRISGRFPGRIFEKKKKQWQFTKTIFIVGNSEYQLNNMYELFKNILEEKITKIENTKNYKKIESEDYELYFAIKNENSIHGYKCHYYINLTNDAEFEIKYLEPMLIK